MILDGDTNVTSNYDITYQNGTLTVTAATGNELDITDYSGVYDSEAHGITVENAIAGDTVWYSLTNDGTDWTQTNPTFTDVTAETTVYVKVTNANYSDRLGQGTVTITVRPISILAGSDSKTYDGAALTSNTWTLSAGTLAGTETISAVTVTGSQTVVGSSSNVPSGAVILDGDTNMTSNYDITYQNGTLTVSAKAITVTAGSGTVTYNGTQHTITSYTSTDVVTGQSLTAIAYGAGTNVGNYPVTVGGIQILEGEADVTGNYTITLESGTLTITKATVNITLTAISRTTTYNGTTQSVSGWTLTGDLLNGTTTISGVAGATGTNVGTYPTTFGAVTVWDGSGETAIDVTENYTINLVNGLLTIQRRPGGGGGGGTTIIDELVPLALITDHIEYIQGYPENVVKPEGLVTREEVAAVFFRLLEPDYREILRATESDFLDMSKTRWSGKHVGTLVNGSIIQGYPDGTFKPGNPITRAELAAIASRFDDLQPTTASIFSDIKGHWAEKYINSAQEKGWVNGYPDGTFKPQQYITRAEFVTLVNNVLQRRVHKADILPDAKTFPDLKEAMWYYEAMMEAINPHLYNRLEDGYEEWIEIYEFETEM